MSVTLNQLARAMSRAASRSEAAHAEMSGAAVAWAEANCAGCSPAQDRVFMAKFREAKDADAEAKARLDEATAAWLAAQNPAAAKEAPHA